MSRPYFISNVHVCRSSSCQASAMQSDSGLPTVTSRGLRLVSRRSIQHLPPYQPVSQVSCIICHHERTCEPCTELVLAKPTHPSGSSSCGYATATAANTAALCCMCICAGTMQPGALWGAAPTPPCLWLSATSSDDSRTWMCPCKTTTERPTRLRCWRHAWSEGQNAEGEQTCAPPL
jgi:hypothetical protein